MNPEILQTFQVEDLEAAPPGGERPERGGRGGMAQLSRGANLFFPASPAPGYLALQHKEGGKAAMAEKGH